MNNEEYTICKGCLNGGIENCSLHFNIKPASTKKELLINELEILCSDLPTIFERTYLVEKALGNDNREIHSTGELEFWGNNNSYVLHNNIFYPVSMYTVGSNKIVGFSFKILIKLMRHHPTTLKIWEKHEFDFYKGSYKKTEPLYQIKLIDFMDSLHCESIKDYSQIVKLSQQRLNNLIEQIKVESQQRLNDF